MKAKLYLPNLENARTLPGISFYEGDKFWGRMDVEDIELGGVSLLQVTNLLDLKNQLLYLAQAINQELTGEGVTNVDRNELIPDMHQT